MPKCSVCHKETPVTQFYLVRWYDETWGWWLYFCGQEHLEEWFRKKMPPPKPVADGWLMHQVLGPPSDIVRHRFEGGKQ